MSKSVIVQLQHIRYRFSKTFETYSLALVTENIID